MKWWMPIWFPLSVMETGQMPDHPLIYPLKDKRVWVAGQTGMVGSALVRRLQSAQCEVLSADRTTVDLCRQTEVEAWLADNRPDAIFLAAAKVGGILANSTFPAAFLYENLMIEANVIHAAQATGVEKLMLLGSSCIYPKHAAQPITEDAMLTGPLEPTNEWYAIAKIAGVKLCQAYRRQFGSDFISVMPPNLYGEHDTFDLQSSHVLPALMAKAHMAKMQGDPHLEVWGTGAPRREFLHVDDAAAALVFLMQVYSGEAPVNVGTGSDLSIRELAEMICDVVGYKGGLQFLTDKPDGTQLKRLDVSVLTELGWHPRIALRDGIERTYRWYCQTLEC